MECDSLPLSNSGKQGDIKGRTGTSATGSPALSFVSEGGILTSAQVFKDAVFSTHSLLVALKYEIFI